MLTGGKAGCIAGGGLTVLTNFVKHSAVRRASHSEERNHLKTIEGANAPFDQSWVENTGRSDAERVGLGEAVELHQAVDQRGHLVKVDHVRPV